MKHLIYKTSKILAIILLSISLTTIFSSCSKDSSNPTDNGGNGGGSQSNTLTLNGDGWTNKSVTITTVTATYKVSEQLTAFTFFCSDNITMVVITSGNQSGTTNFTNSTDGPGSVVITSGTGQNIKGYSSKTNGGTITISSYGNVLGSVKGSISGTMVNVTTQAEVTISCNFSATRTTDAP